MLLLLNAMIDRPASEIERIFMDYAERPGYAFTGAPIGVPQYALDGYVEMAFENVIMYFDPQNPYPVMLRPLPIWLGMAQEAPRFLLAWIGWIFVKRRMGWVMISRYF